MTEVHGVVLRERTLGGNQHRYWEARMFGSMILGVNNYN